MYPDVSIEQNFIATKDYSYNPPFKCYIYVEKSKDTYEVIKNITSGSNLTLDDNIKKVTNGMVSSEIIKAIENAIKFKLRSSLDYSPPQMPDAIMSIPQSVSGTFGEKTIRQNGLYNANEDFFDGYNTVRVEVESGGGGSGEINLLDTTFTSNGSYIPPEGYDGFFEINVNVPEKEYNSGEREFIQNGEYFASTYGYDGFSKVSVNVPSNNYSFGEREFTANGTYNANDFGVDGFNRVTVNLNIQEGEFIFGSTNINENGEFFANNYGYNGFTSVNVNVEANPNLQDIDISANGNYIPDRGYDGFFNVNVNVPANVTSLQISANGTYNPPVGSGLDGYNDIFVSVPANVTSIQITENGHYFPNSGSGLDGYNDIFVAVPEKIIGETSAFTSNGLYNANDYGFDGFNRINIAVPEKVIGERSVITANGEYLASANSLDGFSKVNVQVPSSPSINVQTSKSVTLSDSNTINPDSGYDAMGKVIVTVTHPPLQDQKSLSVSYGTTTINPDGTNVAMKKVIVTTPAQPTFGFREFTSNGLYNANTYGFNGFNQIRVNVPSGGPSMNVNKVVFYKSGSTNVLINDNRYVLGGYPTFGFDYSGISRVYVGDAIVDGSHMFENTNINAGIDHSIGSSTGEFYDYSYMFNNCQLFNNYLPFFEIRNAVSLEYMFCDCINYDYAGVPIISTYPGYTNVSAESMFRNCTKLYSVEVPISMDIAGLYDCSNMFRNCTSYSRDVNFPNSIKESKYMFSECTSFNGNIKFNLSATYMNINNMAYMFNGCTKFNSNLVNVTNLGSNSFYMMFANCHNFSRYVPNLYSGSYGLVVDHCLNTCRMFINCYKFNQKINICSHSINTNVSNMFLNCNNMNSFVNIYLSGAAKFIAIDMFRGCNNFRSNVYILKALDTDIIQNSSYLFTSSIYNRNIQASSQPYRMNIICGSTNIYNALLRDMSMPPTWTTFSDGVYNTKYNVYVYNHL